MGMKAAAAALSLVAVLALGAPAVGADDDVTDPTVDLTTPADGAVYLLDQVVNAGFTCADEDGGSGLASCTGTVTSGQAIDTSTQGDHSFTVTATDNAGHTTTVTHTYTVWKPKPDGWISNASPVSYVGDHIYNTTGVNQTRRGMAAPGDHVTYYVRVENDAPYADRIRLKGTATTSAFSVAYHAGTTSITSAVTGGTYLTPSLAPGATFLIKVTVTVRSGSPSTASLTGQLIAKSNTQLLYRDTVRFVTSNSQGEVRRLVNATRASYGLRALTAQSQLDRKAQAWAEHLASIGRLEHSNLSSGVPSGWRALGENVGVSSSISGTHNAFLNSPNHRKNILDRRWNYMGTGVAWRGSRVYVVQVFMQR